MKVDTIVCGDCLDVMADMPDGYVDLVVTDPPYGIGFVSGYYKGGNPFGAMASDDITNAVWLAFVARIIKPTGAIYCFSRWDVLGVWKQLFEFFGLRVKSCIVWDKQQTGMGDLKGAYAPSHEMILFATRGRHIFRRGRPPDIIRIQRTGAKRIHPTEKPIALMEELILNSSDEGAIVADFFMGSGTTAVAALKLGRHFYGCDINPDYVKLANERIEKARLEMSQIEMSL